MTDGTAATPDPSAISPEAPARPPRRRARRGAAVALARRGGIVPRRAAAAIANAMAPAGLHPQKWERSAGRRAPADRDSRRRAVRSGRGSAGHRAGLARGARDAGTHGRAGHRPTARSRGAFRHRWRAGASRPTTAPAGPCRPGCRRHVAARHRRCRGEGLAPVALLALLKHPLVGGEGEERLAWLERVRALDLALRGPRPPAGLAGLDRHCGEKAKSPAAWVPRSAAIAAPLDGLFDRAPTLAAFARGACANAAHGACRRHGWRGPAGAWRPICSPSSRRHRPARPPQIAPARRRSACSASCSMRVAVRPPYGGHPRI